MKFGSLFTGVGGIDLGLEKAGMECAWQVEKNEQCLEVYVRQRGHPASSRVDWAEDKWMNAPKELDTITDVVDLCQREQNEGRKKRPAVDLRKQPRRDCGHHEYDAHVQPVGGREMCRYCWAKRNWPSFVLCGCGRQFARMSQACGLCQREQNEEGRSSALTDGRMSLAGTVKTSLPASRTRL